MKLSGKQAIGLTITGAATGAILALLYAPKSGAQTRRDVRRFTRKTADRLDDLQEDIRDQVGCWVEEVNDAVRGSIRSGKKAVEAGRNRIEEKARAAWGR